MFATIRRWFAKRQRQVDIDILFPVIREQAATTEQAAFTIWAHMLGDDAGRKYYTTKQLEILAREYAHDTN